MAGQTPPNRGAAIRNSLLWLLAALFVFLGVRETLALTQLQPLGVDFLPLWTAGRLAWTQPGEVYDAGRVTAAQAWLLPHLAWPRPYAYPPTALLALAPVGQLPFWPAFWAWNGLGLAAILAGAWRLAGQGRSTALALTAVAPPVVLALLVGQSVLLAAGLASLGVAWLPARPRLAGALLALAAALKPQAVVLAPIALVACGAWEAFASAALVGAVLAALSVALFGFGRWSEWLATLGPFQAEIAAVPGMMAGVIAPTGLAHTAGLAGAEALAVRAVIGLGGVALVWLGFRRGAGAALRAAALLCGGLLVSPYAMHYDASLLLPAAAARASGDTAGRDWPLRLVAFLAVAEATLANLGAVLIVAFAALTLWQIMVSAPHAATGAGPSDGAGDAA